MAAHNDGLIDDLKPIVGAAVAGRSANASSQCLRESYRLAVVVGCCGSFGNGSDGNLGTVDDQGAQARGGQAGSNELQRASSCGHAEQGSIGWHIESISVTCSMV
jgi:hypothetical protein